MLRRKTSVVAALAGVAAVGVLGACSSSTSSESSPSGMTQASVTLTDMPTGEAVLNFDSGAQQLTVQYSMYGLAPTSTHPNAIQEGTCEKPGKTLYNMDPLLANAAGVADATNQVTNVTQSSIPRSGWILNVLNGPGATEGEQALSIACAPISGPDSPLTLPMTKAGGTDSNPSGSATLSIENGQLVSTITMSGLAPNTAHAAHIHAGACNNQGDVLYPYPTITSDASGNASVSLTVPNVASIPTTGWYVNVHRSTALHHQTGFDPIACGNVGS